MIFLKNHYFNRFLLLCLVFQGFSPLLMAAETATQEPEPIIEHRISKILGSPIRTNYQATTKEWISHYTPPTKPSDALDEDEKALFRFPELLSHMTQGDKEKLLGSKKTPFLNDLQFINHYKEASILENIKKTIITKAGNLSLYTLLNQDFQPLEIVKKRQEFIRILVENPSLLLSIQEFLTTIKDQENAFLDSLSYCKEYDLEWRMLVKIISQLYTGARFFETSAQFTRGQIRGVLSLLSLSCYLLALAGLAVKALAPSSIRYPDWFVNTLEKSTIVVAPAMVALSVYLAKRLYDALAPTFSPNYRILLAIALMAATAVPVYMQGSSLYDFCFENKKIFEYMKPLVAAQKATINIHEILTSTTETESLYLDLFADTSQQWDRICKKIDNTGIDENSSYNIFTTPQGTIKNLIREVKEGANEFGTVFRFYGEIDAYQSIAQMIIDHKGHTNSFDEPVTCCFAEFVTDNPIATLNTKNFWFPLFNKSHVRPSSIALGEDPDLTRCGIITGPNAGGKTGVLKAIFNNILWAQTFGVAFAESFRFTPFKLLINRTGSVDNAAQSSSKFVTEARNAAEFFKQIDSLKENEHAFIMTDELFSGTEPKPAKLLSEQVCEGVSHYRNTIYLLATHYKRIARNMPTRTNNIFGCYKVNVSKDAATGKLIYEYTLKPGIGDQMVAFDIFKEQLKKEENESNKSSNQIIINLVEKAQEQYEKESNSSDSQ
ncbi:hypothetical protein FJ366_02575 [Candidatus Dependentiae bacterium]|nr:hypothetical protein [Candidatus Dependentiae bacterium]